MSAQRIIKQLNGDGDATHTRLADPTAREFLLKQDARRNLFLTQFAVQDNFIINDSSKPDAPFARANREVHTHPDGSVAIMHGGAGGAASGPILNRYDIWAESTEYTPPSQRGAK